MDMMMLGETIGHTDDTTAYFGFWMPSGGDDATGAIDVVVLTTASVFTVKLQTKNSEDADPNATTNMIGSSAITATGVTKFDASSAQELVRYVITSSSQNVEHMHFQLMQPQWVPN